MKRALLAAIVLVAMSLVCAMPAEAQQVLTVEQWRWVQRWFPNDTLLMSRIASCESRFDDWAVSEDGAIGRLQIMPMHARRLGIDPMLLHDPDVNGAVGAILLAERPDAGAWALTRDGCAWWRR